MNDKAVGKFVVDVMMTLALLLTMGYQFWGEAPHEWIGAGMFVLFIVHHILNGHWHKSICKGKYHTLRIVMLCVDFLVLVSMILQMYSAMVISRHLFHFLPFRGGMSLARRLHILGAYWGFLLMSLHLGLHWNMILAMVRKTAKINCSFKIRRAVMFLAGFVIASYGVWAFIRRDFFTYLFLKSEFVFLDYSEPKILFYIDYFALMGCCIFIAHYSTKIIRKFMKKAEKQQ